ncbi:MAG: Uma2 family endonuclease [Myxococcales bacterium]|nr:Uma2 family endonuclease [Myxococcales bacterium]
MSLPAKKAATYDDLVALPPHVVGEIINGELEVSPRPASPHAFAASVLGMDLGGAFQRGRGGPGGWWLFDEPELHLGRHVLVPDLAGWRRERMASPADAPFFTLTPDWICEVVSPSTAARDRGRKLPIYAEHEVAFAWLVDPLARTVEAYRRQGPHWLLLGTYADDVPARIAPFDAIELDVAALWMQAQRESP